MDTYQPLQGNGGSQQSFNISRSGSDPRLESQLGVEDVHCRLMRRYKDAPLTWYILVFISMLAIATFTVE
jgi:hypothetical protein